MWRCVRRLDYGNKYCRKSPTLDEGDLQMSVPAAIDAIMSRKDESVSQLTIAQIEDAIRTKESAAEALTEWDENTVCQLVNTVTSISICKRWRNTPT